MILIRKTDFTVADYGHNQVSSLIIMLPHRMITFIGIEGQSYVAWNTPEPHKKTFGK